MKRGFLTLVLLTASSATAMAQTIVFQDGFENGFAQWTATGLWNSVLDSTPCMSSVAPFPDGVTAAWYGSPTTCTFDTGVPNSGRLELTTWVTLPSNVASVSLYFASAIHSEYCGASYDLHRVQVMAQNAIDTGFTAQICSPMFAPQSYIWHIPWHERRIDLSAYRGAQVRVAFEFDTVDVYANAALGWLVDDVRILSETGVPFCPSDHPLTWCPCAPNLGWGGGCQHAAGESATLMSGGQASVASDSLTITAAHLPPGTAAVLFQGTIPITPVPWMAWFGNGIMCVGGSLTRMGTAPAPTGALAWPLTGSSPLSITGLVPPFGGDRYYQVLFRDALICTFAPYTFNLTSAEKITWAP